jgi:hypothetical protein
VTGYKVGEQRSISAIDTDCSLTPPRQGCLCRLLSLLPSKAFRQFRLHNVQHSLFLLLVVIIFIIVITILMGLNVLVIIGDVVTNLKVFEEKNALSLQIGI